MEFPGNLVWTKSVGSLQCQTDLFIESQLDHLLLSELSWGKKRLKKKELLWENFFTLLHVSFLIYKRGMRNLIDCCSAEHI